MGIPPMPPLMRKRGEGRECAFRASLAARLAPRLLCRDIAMTPKADSDSIAGPGQKPERSASRSRVAVGTLRTKAAIYQQGSPTQYSDGPHPRDTGPVSSD